MNNLYFSRVKSTFFWVQYFQWLFSVWYLFYFFQGKSPIADFPTLGYVAVAYLLRSSSIAGKYATYPKNLYKKMKEQPISDKIIRNNLMLYGWFSQTEEVIQLEIDSTLKRAEIDDALFKIAFLADINDESKAELKNIIEANSEYYKFNQAVTFFKTDCTNKPVKYFDAKLIFEFMIREYNKKQGIPLLVRAFIILYAIFNAFWPAGIRAIFGQSMFGSTPWEYVCYGGNGINTIWTVYITIMFFAAGLRDMRRKAFILNQLG